MVPPCAASRLCRGAAGDCSVTGFLLLEDETVFHGESVGAWRSQPSLEGRALLAGVSTDAPDVYAEHGRLDVAVVDYGTKRSILRRLAGSGVAVTVFPHDVDADELARFDGVVLSNGP